MASDQESDPEIQASRITNLELKDLPLSWTNLTLLCDISTDRERPLVPLNWKKEFLTQSMAYLTLPSGPQ